MLTTFPILKFDYIVHLAGKAHDKGATWSDFEINNINLTQDVVNLADENNNTKIIYFLFSKSLWGNIDTEPLSGKC
jgi:nucleoside-diphosphate-sugar epimerase